MNNHKLSLLKIFFSFCHFLPSSIAVKLAEKLFTTPFSSDRREIEKKLLKKAEKFSIQQGAKNTISAYRWGDKNDPIILFAHGWTSTGTCFIKFIEPLLSNGYQVVSYDFIAHGETKGSTSASITQWADCLVAVSEKVGQVYCIIGHSLGAGSIIVAGTRRLNTEKLILISPVTNIIKLTEIFGEKLLIPPKIIKKMQVYAWNRYQDNASKYGKDWQNIFESEINVPTLLIHDQDDSEVFIEDTIQFANKIPHATLIKTNMLGHRRILLNPPIIRASLAFISNKTNN